MSTKEKLEKRLKRKARVRSKIRGDSERPRLNIFRSNKHIFAQVIDDIKGETVVSVSDKDVKGSEGSKKSLAFSAGELLAQKAIKKKIKKVVFDKGGYKYHGRVKEFADGARKGGLSF